MIPRKEISKLIEEYLNQEIEPRNEARLLKLMEENPFVKEEFILRKKIDQSIKNKEVMDLRDQLRTLIENKGTEDKLEEPRPFYQSKYLKIAASIILIFGLSMILNLMVGKKPGEEVNNGSPLGASHSPDISESPKYTSSDVPEVLNHKHNLTVADSNTLANRNNRPKPKAQLADIGNYKKSKYFESYIDNFRSPEIRILLPAASATFEYGSEIMFIWNYHPSEDSLHLSIFDNKENRLFYLKVDSEYILKIDLKPGIYYWKLESEEDLIFMNKFYVR